MTSPKDFLDPQEVLAAVQPSQNEDGFMGGFKDANGNSVKEGDEVEYRFGARRGTLTYCGHDGAAWVRFFDSGKDEDVNWVHLCGVRNKR